MKNSEDLYGLVLAGGHSTRMGTDKGLLAYNGKPQRDYLFDLLAIFCGQVFTSCRKDQQVPPRLNPLFDSTEIPGPLNGILSAFRYAPGKSWLVVAVDMPFVNAQALQLLISRRDQQKMATCFYNAVQDAPEPLLSLWEPKAYSHLLKFAESGQVSPREFLKNHPVTMVSPPDKRTLVNINFPEEKP